jgi:hypothetical protein
MVLPNTLQDIRNKVRRITARPSSAQISDAEIDGYINTFYIYDMPEHLRLQNLRVNYQFMTTANIAVYDFPVENYLTNMPPVFIGGYQSFMTQSRENFFRINPSLNFLQQSIYTGNNTSGPYSGQFLTQTPVMRGFKPNPPGAYSPTGVLPSFLNWNVVVSGIDANGNSSTLVDDGGGAATLTPLGNLVDPKDPSSTPTVRGTVNYITGALAINATGFPNAIPAGNPINVQYIPYVASRPQSVVFFQDQFILYPVPDQAYTVSFEAFKYPTELISAGESPQLNEWWQLLAYGAADKIFADNGDLENVAKFRPLLLEQMNLVQRRTLVQYTSERVATIYTEQTQFPQYPFGNLFSGF